MFVKVNVLAGPVDTYVRLESIIMIYKNEVTLSDGQEYVVTEKSAKELKAYIERLGQVVYLDGTKPIEE